MLTPAGPFSRNSSTAARMSRSSVSARRGRPRVGCSLMVFASREQNVTSLRYRRCSVIGRRRHDMASTLDPTVLGPLMIIFTVLWFGAMSWAGMHEDGTPRRATRPRSPDEPGPWWTNDGFDD